VIASGDLTDAKDERFGSGQYMEEWEAYQSALKDADIFSKTTWMDIRGNHDNFNVQVSNTYFIICSINCTFTFCSTFTIRPTYFGIIRHRANALGEAIFIRKL
jgi:hypothetical protein